MKKSKIKNQKSKILVLSVLCASLFAACEKDKLPSNVDDDKISDKYELPNELKYGVTIKNGMMVFPNVESYDKLTTLLEEENQKYVDQYFASKAGMTEAELDSFIVENEDDLFEVYNAFECYHSFYSARKLYFDKTNEWLNMCTDIVDFESKPFAKPISERLQPFANIDGEYMIGNTIYCVEDDGLVYEIRNSDFKALNSIRNNSGIELRSANSNVIIHRSEVRRASLKASTYDNVDVSDSETECKSYVRKTHNHFWATNRFMYCQLDIDWDGYGSAAKAKIECYKIEKNWRGKLSTKREWRSMGAYVNVNDYRLNLSAKDGDEDRCIYQESKKEMIHRNKAYYVSTRVTIVDDVLGARVVPGQEGGQFYLSDSHNYEYKMTW